MGFNFGAFAAGAIEGAGDIMEKQHKETKDSIDANMKFAYEQGLPFHRQRMKDKRRFEGYASTLQNMQLGADQVSVVMGKSEDFIKDFIAKSSAEKLAKPEFDIPSQVTVKEGGNITDWRNVQLGVIDLPKVNQPTQSSSSSLLGSMLGTNRTSGNSKGFNRLVDKTRSQMESITGTSYDSVAAAGQQAYSYDEGSEGTVNIVSTAAQLDIEGKQLQIDQITQMNPLILDAARWNATNRQTVAARAEAQEEFEVTKRKWIVAAGEYRFAKGLDKMETDNKIAQITENIKIRKYGTSPESGLYALHLAIAEEQDMDNPDLEKIASLQKGKIGIGIFLGELRADQNQASSDISYAQWNSSYDSRVNEILALTVDAKNPAWVVDKFGNRSFDFNLGQSREMGKQAKARATSEFVQSIRELNKKRPISGDLQQWLIVQDSFDIDLVTLDVMPDDESDIVDDKLYVILEKRIPSGAEQNDSYTYSYSAPEDYDPVRDGLLKKHPLPTHKTWIKLTGAQHKARLARRRGNITPTSNSDPYAENRQDAASASTLYAAPITSANKQLAQIDEDPQEGDATISWWDNPQGLGKDGWFKSKISNIFSSISSNVTDAAEAKAHVRKMVAANKKKNPSDDTIIQMNEIYFSLSRKGQGKMTTERYEESLRLLMQNTSNSRHMAWAINELADLLEQ